MVMPVDFPGLALTDAVHLQDSLQELAEMPEKDRLAAIDRVIEALKKKEKEEQNKKIKEIEKAGGKAVIVNVCAHSGYAATPACKDVKQEVLDSKDPKANFFCPVHNPDKKKYPIKK